MSVRDLLDEREKRELSPYAKLSCETKGRLTPLEPDDMRTEFQRDRDRIIHSKSFRRLMHKTQVFLSPEHDHYRTRLTHTFEVTQIARSIARSLRLNEDLTEAIALGHDLGHTPFGHAGERLLQRCYDPEFTHCKQSLRVVDHIDRLNLTHEVRNGILCHAGDSVAETLEGVIVKYADRIAYINHDIDDACRAGILNIEDIPKEIRDILGDTHSGRIDTMIRSVVKSSEGKNEISMESDIWEATCELRSFLFKTVYVHPDAKGQEKKAEKMLEVLFEYFCEKPALLPKEYLETVFCEGAPRAVCDYIAGMTDRYAINVYRNLFIPKVWGEGEDVT